ncbi:MAG: hypothetical protein ACK5KP_04580 [Paludibacteraceae bacterium]
MTDNNEYISVSEFAKRANVSKQSVYKRLNNKLTKYVKLIDGKKMLNIQGLKLYEQAEKKSTNEQFIEQLLSQVNYLKNQNNRLSDMLENEQKLHAMTQSKLYALESKEIDDASTKAENDSNPDKKWWQFWKEEQ